MTTSDAPQRAGSAWVWAVVLLTLAVAVPVAAVVMRDEPGRVTRDQAATMVVQPTPEPTAEPSASLDPRSAAAPVRALLFGDSFFIGGGYTDEDNSMARLASNRLDWVSEINGGGGTGFVQTNEDYDLGNYLDQIAAGAFDVGPRRWVVIQGGNNDVGQPLDDIRANARRVLRIAQRTFPDARVVLVGPLDTDSDHSDIAPVIKVLRQAARKRSVPYVNMKDWLAGHYDLIGPDFVHPYPKGHRILGRKLARALRGLGA